MQLPFLFIYTGGASLHTAHNSSKCEDQQAETSPAMPPCDPLPGSLTFLTSGGLGNQYYGLQIAAWLAIALRRGTLVVPPILRHFKLGSPAGRGCESVDAAAAADGSQREHATRAQQIWLDMERRGVADSWGLLLDFGCSGPAPPHRRCRIPSWRAEARVAFHHCGRLASGWKLDRFQVALAAPAAAEISVGATFNNIDTDALTLCEFTASCERAVAARALRWRLAPSLKRETRLALRRALGAGAETRMHAVHIRSGYGETKGAAWTDHVAATVRPLRAALARSRVGRPLVYVAADVPWDTLMGAHVDGVADLCARAVRRQRRALRALNWRVGELGEAQGFRDTEVARMAFDVAACALAATFWASTLRASSFSRLVQDVRRGEGRSPVANASAAVRLVGTLPRCENGCRRTRANNNCSAGRRDYRVELVLSEKTHMSSPRVLIGLPYRSRRAAASDALARAPEARVTP